MDPSEAINQGWLREKLELGSTNIEQPILQCVQIKPLGVTAEKQNRFRVVVSDTRNYVQSMLNISLNDLINNGALVRGCIVKIKQYKIATVKERAILILVDLEVLEGLGVHEKIGNPLALVDENQTGESEQPISANGFYGAKAEPQPQVKKEQQPQRQVSTANDSAYGYIHPIESLSPYNNKWVIKARVTNKSDIKHWHNRNGEGKLFSVNLLDESGEIKATGFNDQVDSFYELLQEGGVYYISTCKCAFAKKQFNNVNNIYELTFENNTTIEKAESQSDVPQIRFNFTTIGSLQSVEKDAVIDVIGVLRDVGEVSEIISKTTQKPYSKREITLVDNTNFSVRLTLWGTVAGNFNAPLESVVAFKSVKVSDFGGRSLSLLSSGTISIDPDVNEAHTLKGWYDAQGKNDQFSSHANGTGDGAGRPDNQKTIAAVKEENLGMSEKGDYFSIKATVVHPRQENFAYPACLSEGCQKKVISNDEGWRCEKCEKTHPNPKWRYMMSVSVTDHTGQMFLSFFNDQGTVIMGMTADKLVELKENNKEKDAMNQAINKQYVFRCRAKQDTYGEQTRLAPLDYGAEAAKLFNKIKLYD
ncbi:MAG: hypothetical protein GOMPHAMPRED_006836 [Gomphillus americanus]|uniref:Replication protein A subunit n=1 Tax=Gomphillus americanus TaxID=1940652 RepID=A0A8H3I6X8_9LECA|nr:MAG: hypothetical protein GOMPHAMPRED_006836 [Gomphillus americanus]